MGRHEAKDGYAHIAGFPNKSISDCSVELRTVQEVPEETTLVPKDDDNKRRSGVVLTPDQAREVGDALHRMADEMENVHRKFNTNAKPMFAYGVVSPSAPPHVNIRNAIETHRNGDGRPVKFPAQPTCNQNG